MNAKKGKATKPRKASRFDQVLSAMLNSPPPAATRKAPQKAPKRSVKRKG